MINKLFEKLVTKFAIKSSDLSRFLVVSKATIYNYRNLNNFNELPNDKKYKIFHLFGKNSVPELEVLVGEDNPQVLYEISQRLLKLLSASLALDTKVNPMNLTSKELNLILDNILSYPHFNIKHFTDFLEVYLAYLKK